VPPHAPVPAASVASSAESDAALLAVALTGSPAGLTPLAAASAQAPSLAASAKSTEVGELTYSDGAGSRTWGLRKHARVVHAGRQAPVRRRYGRRLPGFLGRSWGPARRRLHGVLERDQGREDREIRQEAHRQLNITYVNWDQRIWSVARAGDGWRRMSDLGSVTANHKDHVHISFRRVPRDHTYQR
jgi:hypothetical protein